MSTANIRIGSVVARQVRQEHLAQLNSGTIALKQTTERELPGRHANEEWMRSMEKDWQGHLEMLQEQMCELLLRNQPLRMALNAANKAKEEYKNARSF